MKSVDGNTSNLTFTDKQKQLLKYLRRIKWEWDKRTYQKIVQKKLYSDIETAYNGMRSLARKGFISSRVEDEEYEPNHPCRHPNYVCNGQGSFGAEFYCPSCGKSWSSFPEESKSGKDWKPSKELEDQPLVV
jgi:Fe2+ or Zn2+ uptake regulation protein